MHAPINNRCILEKFLSLRLASSPSVEKHLAFKPCVLMRARLQFDGTTPNIGVTRTVFCDVLEKRLDLVLGANGKDTPDKHIFFDR